MFGRVKFGVMCVHEFSCRGKHGHLELQTIPMFAALRARKITRRVMTVGIQGRPAGFGSGPASGRLVGSTLNDNSSAALSAAPMSATGRKHQLEALSSRHSAPKPLVGRTGR